MIEEVDGPPTKRQCSPHYKILEWLEQARPGQWMRMPVDRRNEGAIRNAIRYHLHSKGIYATMRRTPGFLYIGRKS